MRRLLTVLALGSSLAMVSAGPVLGAIHPIVSSECSSENASSVAGNEDPVGQTPTSFNPADWDQSDLRALFATGVLYWNTDGSIGFDPTVAALHGNSGAAHCPNA